MIAVQALEKHAAELKQKEAQIAVLESKIEDLKVRHAYFESVATREALELRKNHSIQIPAEDPWVLWQEKAGLRPSPRSAHLRFG